MSHDKIRDAARRRMAATGESYSTARRRVIAEQQADGPALPAPALPASALSAPALSAEDIRAAAAAHGELGPEYGDAVLASFLEKVDQEIAARVDARLAASSTPQTAEDRGSRGTLLSGIAIGIAIGAVIAVAVGGNPGERIHRLVIVMLVLAVICAVGASRSWAVPRRRAAPSARAGRTGP
jgi:hypothetical protein